MQATTLQQPVRDPGILFAVQQSEKTSSLFWSPDLASYFAYRKGGSSLTFLMEEEQKIWFYGGSEAAVEIGRLWAEIGPLCGLAGSFFRIGDQVRGRAEGRLRCGL